MSTVLFVLVVVAAALVAAAFVPAVMRAERRRLAPPPRPLLLTALDYDRIRFLAECRIAFAVQRPGSAIIVSSI